MKYKYVVGLLVALSFNSGFAMDADYAAAYKAVTAADVTDAVTRINIALAGKPDFDTNLDPNVMTGFTTGHELRKLVIGLERADLQTVVEENHEFFKKSFGMHLLLCNVLNRFANPYFPCYILKEEFSFRAYFGWLTDQIADDRTKMFFKSRFNLGLPTIDASMDSRWEFQVRNFSILYAIEQAGGHGDLSMDGIIGSCDLDDAGIRAERQARALRIAPGRAAHLFGDLGDAHVNREANNFVGLQKYTIQVPKLCEKLNQAALAIFQSLPADTDIDAFRSMDLSVSEHITAFRAAIEEADAPVDAPLQLARAAFAIPAALALAEEQEHREKVLLPEGGVTKDKIGLLKILLVRAPGAVCYPPTLNDWVNAFKANASIDPAEELDVKADRKTQQTVFAAICDFTRTDDIRKAAAAAIKKQEEAFISAYQADLNAAFRRFNLDQRPKKMALNLAEVASLKRIMENRKLKLPKEDKAKFADVLAGKEVTGAGRGLNDKGRVLDKVYKWLVDNSYDGKTPYKTQQTVFAAICDFTRTDDIRKAAAKSAEEKTKAAAAAIKKQEEAFISAYQADLNAAFRRFNLDQRPKKMALNLAEVASLKRIMENRKLKLPKEDKAKFADVLAGKEVTGAGRGLNDKGRVLDKVYKWLVDNSYDGKTPYKTQQTVFAAICDFTRTDDIRKAAAKSAEEKTKAAAAAIKKQEEAFISAYQADLNAAFRRFNLDQRPKKMALNLAEVASLKRIMENRKLKLPKEDKAKFADVLAGKEVTGAGRGLNDKGRVLDKVYKWLVDNSYDGKTPYKTQQTVFAAICDFTRTDDIRKAAAKSAEEKTKAAAAAIKKQEEAFISAYQADLNAAFRRFNLDQRPKKMALNLAEVASLKRIMENRKLKLPKEDKAKFADVLAGKEVTGAGRGLNDKGRVLDKVYKWLVDNSYDGKTPYLVK